MHHDTPQLDRKSDTIFKIDELLSGSVADTEGYFIKMQ